MAMDKEQLLRYFSTHYLSRREVLFRLPLNISIGNFWPELLNRRKSNATVLPLYDGSGKPYWFVLTDKMVQASERLCSEAMNRETGFDPYKTQPAAEMKDEIFFTSFVEGAQITRADAMSFLNRNSEPENIGEQMISNNQKALTAVLGSLFRPIDEEYMKGLAYILTEDMVDSAGVYRLEDDHPIVAMNGEPYELPSSDVLPDRMDDLYAYLSSPDVHPLIKAAIGQAYILVTRPFPEGNERLSRIISQAILLRSGYDFFRDISISAAIAKENYGYYKSMCEIIRSENGGDLTYFIEFYLTVLVQAIDLKNERERKKEQERLKREQENIQREQEMAMQPLSKPEPVTEALPIPERSETNPTEVASVKESEIAVSSPSAEQTVITNGDGSLEPLPNESPPIPEKALIEMENARCPSTREAAARLRKALEAGFTSFTNAQWGEFHGLPIEKCKLELPLLCKYGAVTWQRIRDGAVLYKVSSQPDRGKEPSLDSTKQSDENDRSIEAELDRILAEATSEKEKIVVRILREMLDKGMTTFQNKDWCDMSGDSVISPLTTLNYVIDRGLVVQDNEYKSWKVYRICKTVPAGINNRGLSSRQLEMMGKLYSAYGKEFFTVQNCMDANNCSRSFAAGQLLRLGDRQLVEHQILRNKEYKYRLLVTPESNPECFNLSPVGRVVTINNPYRPTAAPMVAMG